MEGDVREPPTPRDRLVSGGGDGDGVGLVVEDERDEALLGAANVRAGRLRRRVGPGRPRRAAGREGALPAGATFRRDGAGASRLVPPDSQPPGEREAGGKPTEAANEALVNALAHAYYGGTGSVRVVLRPDRLEVSNPGSMLVDRRVAIAGGFSEARNPTLMRIFSLIGASDRAGSGLCEIWSTWGSLYGSAPVLEERHSPSCVTLSLPLPAGAGAAAPATDPSASVLEAVSGAEGGLTPSEAFGAGLYPSVRTAQKQMRALFDAGLVSRRRDGRSWRYLSRR